VQPQILFGRLVMNQVAQIRLAVQLRYCLGNLVDLPWSQVRER
jgi:hypothetical protein